MWFDDQSVIIEWDSPSNEWQGSFSYDGCTYDLTMTVAGLAKEDVVLEVTDGSATWTFKNYIPIADTLQAIGLLFYGRSGTSSCGIDDPANQKKCICLIPEDEEVTTPCLVSLATQYSRVSEWPAQLQSDFGATFTWDPSTGAWEFFGELSIGGCTGVIALVVACANFGGAVGYRLEFGDRDGYPGATADLKGSFTYDSHDPILISGTIGINVASLSCTGTTVSFTIWE